MGKMPNSWQPNHQIFFSAGFQTKNPVKCQVRGLGDLGIWRRVTSSNSSSGVHQSHRIRMYAIYGIIYHQYTPNVSIYTIHGSYGNEGTQQKIAGCFISKHGKTQKWMITRGTPQESPKYKTQDLNFPNPFFQGWFHVQQAPLCSRLKISGGGSLRVHSSDFNRRPNHLRRPAKNKKVLDSYKGFLK